MGQRWWTRRVVVVVLGLLTVGLLVVAGALFQPWRLFVNNRVDEAVPDAAQSQPAGGTTPSSTSRGATADSAEPSSRNTTLSDRTPPMKEPSNKIIRSGQLISHEHPTTGDVMIIQRPDGSKVLRIEDLETTNGPDLRIWLSSAPVLQGRAGWFVFSKHDYIELGALKANQGNQNYSVPATADLDHFSSVTIWCKRFSVSFGASRLTTS